MCDATTAIIISTAITAGATIQQGQLAARQAKDAQALNKYLGDEKQKELKAERDIAKIQTREEEIERRRILEADLDAITAFNKGLESTSIGAIKGEAERLYELDVANLRFNLGRTESGIARQISVVKAESNRPSYANQIKMGSYLQAGASIGQGYYNYTTTKTPPKTDTTTKKTSSNTSQGYGYKQVN